MISLSERRLQKWASFKLWIIYRRWRPEAEKVHQRETTEIETVESRTRITQGERGQNQEEWDPLQMWMLIVTTEIWNLYMYSGWRRRNGRIIVNCLIMSVGRNVWNKSGRHAAGVNNLNVVFSHVAGKCTSDSEGREFVNVMHYLAFINIRN